jgi:hypothetical protein
MMSPDYECTLLGTDQFSVCTGLWLRLSEINCQCFIIRKPPETRKYRLESAARSQIRDSQSRGTEAVRTGQCVPLTDSTVQREIMFEDETNDPRKEE